MPMRPKRYEQRGQRQARPKDHTFNSHVRGYTRRWRNPERNGLADLFIIEQVAIDPRCRYCREVPVNDGTESPYQVDHRDPPSRFGPPGSPAYLDVFWDQSRWVLCCKPCNSRKRDAMERQP